MNKQKKSISQKEIKEVKGTLFLMAAFFVMCVLKLWFTMFLIFLAAVIITIATGKTEYCYSYCPVGTIQEGFYNKNKKKRGGKLPSFIKYFFITAFWGITIFISFYNFSNGMMVWIYMLQIMLSALFIAVVTQNFFKKRYFCSHLCPLRIPVLKPIIKLQRMAKK